MHRQCATNAVVGFYLIGSQLSLIKLKSHIHLDKIRDHNIYHHSSYENGYFVGIGIRWLDPLRKPQKLIPQEN